MSRITDLKRRLFIIVGSIVFIMVAVILLFNLRLLHESMQQTRQNHKRTLQMYTAMFSDAMDQIEDMLISQNIRMWICRISADREMRRTGIWRCWIRNSFLRKR